MRPNRLTLAAALALASFVQAAAQPAADPVIARVGDQEIRLSDLAEASQSLPDEYRGMPQAVLFPLLTDQLVDRAAVVAMARRQGIDKEEAVQRQIARAADQAIENALMSREIGPTIAEPALQARYDRDYAGKEGEIEVHASHILVASEADALKVIEDLKKGGDFAALAKARSSDPGASKGGDLGFFKKSDMVPEFAEAAFALKPGEVTAKPVKTQFGWHVIKMVERRTAAPPSFEQVHDDIRQKLIQEGVQKLVAEARTGVAIERFNADGSPKRATDDAQPPPAPPKP